MNGFKKQIIATEDGSYTISIPDLGISYHSMHGAIQESIHVFIEAGLKTAFNKFSNEQINVLEMGFGTGLNALLTIHEAEKENRQIHYTTLEQFPITGAEVGALNYASTPTRVDLFKAMHNADWELPIAVTPAFTIHKINTDLLEARLAGPYHVIYFDAFAPDVQPALWTETVFKKLYDAMAAGGVLTTYCSKSMVRKAMTAAGFKVKKIPGPLGKREMVQAFKESTVEGK